MSRVLRTVTAFGIMQAGLVGAIWALWLASGPL